jgi:cation:H+ antiporter
MTFILLLVGLALLLIGGMALVRGASGLAAGYGVPPLVVGLTVVAFGTSAPELMINVMAAIRDQSDIAFGNVVGSNLANLGLVLGLSALFTPMQIQGQIVRRELPLLLLASAALLVMCLDSLLRGESAAIDRADSLILLMLFGVFVYITVMDFLKEDQDPLAISVSEVTPTIETMPGKDWVFTVAGAVGLAIGGQLTIENGTKLALMFEVSAAVIGMFVVAIGTSLPELVTSVIAAIRKEADLCVGNVVGSNIFNIMMVLPVGALITPVTIPDYGTLDVFMSLLIAGALIPVFLLGNTLMSRKVGATFVAAYLIYAGLRALGTG